MNFAKTSILSVFMGSLLGIACGAAALAQSGPKSESDNVFLRRMSDVGETLRLEKAFAVSIKTNNRRWLSQTAQRFEGEDVPMMIRLLDNAGDQFKETALKMGPCHYSGLTIRIAVMQARAKQLTIGKNASVGQAVDQEANDNYAEQIRRCELVERLPRSNRLIGNEGF